MIKMQDGLIAFANTSKAEASAGTHLEWKKMTIRDSEHPI